MKTIEELGQVAKKTFELHLESTEKDPWVEVAKAVITALSEDAVSWAVGDD